MQPDAQVPKLSIKKYQEKPEGRLVPQCPNVSNAIRDKFEIEKNKTRCIKMLYSSEYA